MKEDFHYTFNPAGIRFQIGPQYPLVFDRNSGLTVAYGDMETSPLPVKGCKFWPMLGIHGYWAVMVLNVPHLLRHGPTVYNLRGPVTLTPVAERLAVSLSLPVFTTVATGDRTPISGMRGERSTSTPPLNENAKTEASYQSRYGTI